MKVRSLSLTCEELLLDSVEQCLFCCRASYVKKHGSTTFGQSTIQIWMV